MKSQELALSVLETTANVGQSIISMIASVKSMGAISKKSSIMVEEELRLLRHACRLQGVDDLTNKSREKLERIWHDITLTGHTGNMLEMDLFFFQQEFEMFKQIIQDYHHSF